MRIPPHEEAENCRRQALEFDGKPEAAFLINLARMFDDLARQRPSTNFVEPVSL
jgi:hypothetical protein